MPKLKPLAWTCEDEIYNYILIKSHAVNLSQEKIAGRLGMSQQNYSKKLRKRRLTIAEAVEVLEMLDAEVEVKEYESINHKLSRGQR